VKAKYALLIGDVFKLAGYAGDAKKVSPSPSPLEHRYGITTSHSGDLAASRCP
jgi:hypothetical protein